MTNGRNMYYYKEAINEDFVLSLVKCSVLRQNSYL